MFHQRAQLPSSPVASLLPARSRGARIGTILWFAACFWGVRVTIFALADWLEGHPRLGGMIAMRLVLAGFGLLLCLLILYVLRRLAHRALRTRAIAVLLCAAVAAEAYAWVAYFGYGWVNERDLAFTFSWESAVTVVATWSWFFIGWGGVCLALDYHFEAQEERLRAAEFKTLAETAKQRALHSQVNPHFLFNSLNSLSALINDRRVEHADRMIDLLATYFRKMLAVDPSADIPLKEEIGLQLEYLAIEQVRYPDLVVEVDLDPAVERALVPALLLQPLVENAVKHGLARSQPPVKIVVRGRRSGDSLEIKVENWGRTSRGRRPAGTGLGLANVRERLLNRFGERQDLRLEALPDGGGFSATVRIPFEEVP